MNSTVKDQYLANLIYNEYFPFRIVKQFLEEIAQYDNTTLMNIYSYWATPRSISRNRQKLSYLRSGN